MAHQAVCLRVRSPHVCTSICAPSHPPPAPPALPTMDLRSSVSPLAVSSAFGTGSNRALSRCVPFPTRPPIVACPSVRELTPKELHRQRKQQDWKKLRRARRLEQLARQSRLAQRDARHTTPRRREGLCSFEKFQLHQDRGDVRRSDEVQEWRAGVMGKSTLLSTFEEEFALRVRDAVRAATCANGHGVETSTRFREDSHCVGEDEEASDEWLLAYAGRRSGDMNSGRCRFEETVDDKGGVIAVHGNVLEVGSRFPVSGEGNGSRGVGDGNVEIDRNEELLDLSIGMDLLTMSDPLSRSDNGPGRFIAQDERVENNKTATSFERSQLHFIEHSFNNQIPIVRTSGLSGVQNNAASTDSGDGMDADASFEKSFRQKGTVGTLEPWDWRVHPKSARWKDKTTTWQVLNRRKGEPLSMLLDENSDGVSSDTCGILKALCEDVNCEVRRKSIDEGEQLEWLVEELVKADKKQRFFLSRLMHGARLKWTDGRLLELVKILGARREWRRAMEVVHWVHCREHFRHCRSRYVCTTLLAVLGNCLRPVEALNVFNVMLEEHSTYPDMAAYHSIAVTLGKAGHLSQLLHLIESLKEGPKKKNVKGSPKELNWKGRLEPDIVVFNAVINACGPHRQWQGVEWVLQQIRLSGIPPNSTTYGLAVEAMVKSGQYDKAWRYYEIMERGGFLPNSLTFKALVEALGNTGEVDKALQLVEDMERRGVLECAGVYYALATALCTVGRLSEALVQVEKLVKLPSKRPDVVTFTGLIRACDKVGRWQDAISLFNRMQYVCAPNVGTYNIMIALYGRHRLFEEARSLFELVKRGRHKESRFSQANSKPSPTQHTYEAMLGACAACEDWGYFEVVLEEFHTRGFQLDCRRHAWFISPIAKAGQERLIHRMIKHLQHPDEPPNADLYRVFLPLLSTHRRYSTVLTYLDVILAQNVDLSTPEWSSIVGNALEQLPMIDVEQFLCAKVPTVTEVDNILVTELLQCLGSVGAERKARRIVYLLGLEVGAFAHAPPGDARLLPLEDESISLIGPHPTGATARN